MVTTFQDFIYLLQSRLVFSEYLLLAAQSPIKQKRIILTQLTAIFMAYLIGPFTEKEHYALNLLKLFLQK